MIGNVDDPTEIKRYRDVVEISQSMFAGSCDGLRENRKIETESFMMAATFTRTKIKREDLPEGDEIDMCEGMERMAEGFRNEGRMQGREQGILVGRSEGKLEEKRSTLKEQLEIKLGTISNNLELQLTNATLEKLNILTRNIFNITNEEDVLKIIC